MADYIYDPFTYMQTIPVSDILISHPFNRIVSVQLIDTITNENINAEIKITTQDINIRFFKNSILTPIGNWKLIVN